MLNRRKFLSLSAGVVAASSGLTVPTSRSWAQAPVVPENYPADYAKIIEASKGEAGLNIYSNMSAPQWIPTVKGFNEKYPWIKVETLDLGGNTSIERYLAESSTGARTADIILTIAPDSWLKLIERKEILDYASPEAAAYPAWNSPSPGLYTGNINPLVFLWNKALLPEPLHPKSFADFVAKAKANPDVFRGKITTYGPHIASFGYTANYTFAKFHGDKVWDWYSTLGPLTRFESGAGPMADKITTGEYLIGYFLGSGTARNTIRDPARAQIVEMSYISDGTPVLLGGFAIPKAATNVNSAKLMIDYTLSIEGQKTLPPGGRAAFHPRLKNEDVGGGETYGSIVATIGEKNIAAMDYDPKIVTDYTAFIDRWKKASGVA